LDLLFDLCPLLLLLDKLVLEELGVALKTVRLNGLACIKEHISLLNGVFLDLALSFIALNNAVGYLAHCLISRVFKVHTLWVFDSEKLLEFGQLIIWQLHKFQENLVPDIIDFTFG
jgi:hypothetical protein